MSIKTATPYLFFFGRANEALTFYERAFGTTVKTKQLFGPMGKEHWQEKVMHAELPLGEALIMVSDGRNVEAPTTQQNVAVALQFGEAAAAYKAFDALADGGNVEEKLAPAPWGGLFGAVVDRYGIHWMFTAASA